MSVVDTDAVIEREVHDDATGGSWCRPRGPLRAGHRHQALLRVPQPVRRRAQHQRVPGLPRPARLAAGAQRQAVELAMRLGRALHCTVKRSVFARKNYFYPDMPKDYQITPVRPADRTSTATSSCPTAPRRHRAGPHRGGHRQDHPRGRRRPHPRRRVLARRLQPRRRAAGRDRGRPDIRSPSRPRPTSTSCARSSLATGVSDAKMEEGSMRVDANVSVRPRGRASSARAARSRTSTRCARSAGPSSTRPRRQVDLLERGEHDPAGDPPLGRGRTVAPRAGRSKEEADDYRYFPEPDLVPLEPSAAEIAGSTRRCRCCPRRRPRPASPKRRR